MTRHSSALTTVNSSARVDTRPSICCKFSNVKGWGPGPYPHVTMFEAANRIMSDLVILYGVQWLLNTAAFPFDSYTVEYGNENNNGFDVCATDLDKILIGEAFNVAPSFFQTKKASMLKKLAASTADYKIIMFNHDAVAPNYTPKPNNGEYFLFVRVGTDHSYMVPPLARAQRSCS